MGSHFSTSLLLLLCLCISRISATHAADCSSLKLTGGIKQYTNCTELPALNSTLHFTYNATNSSLSIAFSASPAKPDGWIAWAVNPTATGMAGSQTLLAFKSNGSMFVKTYNISSYSSIVEGKLSFDVWDLEAQSDKDGKMVIYGSLKVAAHAEKLNQVWQVGPGVIIGHPMKHEFAKANLDAHGELQLVEKPSPAASSPPPSPPPPPSPEAAKDSNSGYLVSEMNVAFWISGLISLLILM